MKPSAPEPRLWSRIKQINGCWEVQTGLSGGGYSQVYAYGRGRSGHSVMYEAARGPVPPGLELDHLCRNRACCNPDHLEPVTRQVNLLRGNTFAARHAMRTVCVNGHPYTEENTYRSPQGRACRTCRAARNRSDATKSRRRAYRAARRLSQSAGAA